MPRPVGVIIPWYVDVAEATMDQYFSIDLWKMADYHRNRILLAACDAETGGDPAPEDVRSNIEIAVYDEWWTIKRERKRRGSKF